MMKTSIQNSEQKPLLETSASTETIDSGVHLKLGKTASIALVITVALLHMASIILTTYVLNQYSYHSYMEEKYPKSSQKSTSSQSACERNTTTQEYKEQIVVQKLTSELNMYCQLSTYNIIGIVFTLNLATYSDVYGRKIFFIPPLFGTFLKNVLCAIGIYFNIKIEWFILFFAVEGCTGSWVSTLSIVYSFIADITVAGKPRSVIIGLLEGGIGIGAFLATTLSGYLIKWTDGYFFPQVTSVIINAIALLIVVCLLPETLHQSKKREEISFFGNMARVTECYRKNFSPYAKRWMFVILLFIFMMSAFSNIGRTSVETLYQLNAPFCWNSVRIGWYGALRMASLSVGGLVMIKVFHCFTTDEYIALAGCVTTTLSLTVVGLANTDFMLYIALVVGIGSSVTMAIVRAIMSRISPAHKQGSVFAGIAAAETVFSLGSALSANAVYDVTVSIYRGFTFFIMAGFGVIGIILCLILIIRQRHERPVTVVEDVTVRVSPDILKLGYNKRTAQNTVVEENLISNINT